MLASLSRLTPCLYTQTYGSNRLEYLCSWCGCIHMYCSVQI